MQKPTNPTASNITAAQPIVESDKTFIYQKNTVLTTILFILRVLLYIYVTVNVYRPIIIDQDAHGGISELSVGLSVLGVDVMNGRVGVLKSLSESFVSEGQNTNPTE
jgi:hypothetical protein